MDTDIRILSTDLSVAWQSYLERPVFSPRPFRPTGGARQGAHHGRQWPP